MRLRVIVLTVALLSGTPLAYAAQQDAIGIAELGAKGWAAIEQQRYGDALDLFAAAAELAPAEPTVWLGSGFAAYMLGRSDDAERLLEHALSLEPQLIDASRILGDLYHRTGQTQKAIATYEKALELASDDADLAGRLADWKKQDQLHDRFYESRGVHFRVLFEGPSDDALARRIVEMLETAYLNVGGRLGTYPGDAVTVVLYTHEQFQDITRSPAWAAGIYDGQIRVPVRGALENRRELDRVLVHEFVHALVASLGGRAVPMWLNEGLATYFESGGLDRASKVLEVVTSRPSLGDLHGSFARLPGAHASVAYAMSAAAVDRLISMRGPSAVVLLLKDLAQGVSFSSAFHRRMALRYDEFERMARSLR